MPEQDLEKTEERIQAICEKIRLEVLDPAKKEASEIIEKAKQEANHIRETARQDAKILFIETKGKLEEQKRIFEAALEGASRQAVEFLKQKVECSLFNPMLEKWVGEELSGEEEHARLIDVIVQALEKDGIHANLAVKIPQSFSAEKITSLLCANTLKHLRKEDITVADIKGGVKVSLKGRHITLDISEKTIQDIIATFLRKDFRKIFFGM
jgi:V/A-type H+/Na+-transporting ATPase subunit E